MAAVLVGRLSVCGGRQAAGVFSGGGGRASYSVSRQLARVNGLVRGKPPPPRPPSGPASNPVATAVVRFGGKGWDLLLKLSDHMNHRIMFNSTHMPTGGAMRGGGGASRAAERGAGHHRDANGSQDEEFERRWWIPCRPPSNLFESGMIVLGHGILTLSYETSRFLVRMWYISRDKSLSKFLKGFDRHAPDTDRPHSHAALFSMSSCP